MPSAEDGTSCLALGASAAPPPGTLPFVPALYGFVRPTWTALRKSLVFPSEYEIDWSAIERDCLAHLGEQLHRLCRRTLVLELNVARLRGLLRGDTPEQRFHDYTCRLLQDPSEWAALGEEYTVLAQQLGAACERWTRALSELFAALTADFAQVAGLLQPALLRPRLVGLKGGLSAPHRGGRGVFHLTFQEAARPAAVPALARVVYKPRSLAVDAQFQQLLEACNHAAARGALSLRGLRYAAPPLLGEQFPRFRTLRSVDCGDHGWVEFITAEPCASEQEVARFYARQGGFLALLHVLDGADLHHENIIAHGEHPMLVDLEMLFHPWTEQKGAAAAKERAEALLGDSVMRTMLLPGRSWGDRERPELAQRAGHALHAGLLEHKPAAPLGGFGGLPSQLYTLVHLQAILGERRLLSTLDDALRIIAAELVHDDRLDVMYGAAGALLVLLTVHEMTGVEAALAVAVACGRHLTAKARRDAAGACWPVPVAARPLLGFAHGAAGIGGALARQPGHRPGGGAAARPLGSARAGAHADKRRPAPAAHERAARLRRLRRRCARPDGRAGRTGTWPAAPLLSGKGAARPGAGRRPEALKELRRARIGGAYFTVPSLPRRD